MSSARNHNPRNIGILLLLVALVAGTLPSLAAAQVITAFSSRYSTNDTGDIAIIGNTLLSCDATATGCTAARNGTGSTLDDNDFRMVNVDVDSDATTFNSSRSTLALPAGSTVLFAGLYWGADTSASTGGSAAPAAGSRTSIKFLTPASASYVNRTGTQVGISGTRYHVFNDVTALVQAGGNGTYAVANVQAGTGTDRYAGWGLVVVYRAPGEPARNLTVFDGYAIVSSSQPSVNVPVSGFTTPPGGSVSTRLGVVAYEGDLGLTGDALRLNSTSLTNALNPSTNFFNSTIGRLGTRTSAKVPDYINQLGFDLDVVDASGILTNGATSATINLTSAGDTYFPGAVTFATELYAPNVPASKTVTDLNGGAIQPGDVLEYNLSVSNTGQDPATGVVLTDPIPASTTYQTGTLSILTGANAGAKTDAAGDDQANFDSLNNRVLFRLGTGANASVGGTLGIGASTSLRFRVTVNPGTGNGSVISNQASVSYTGQTLGGGFSSASAAPSVSVTANPILRATKTAALLIDADFNGFPSPGDRLRYQMVVTNSGDGAATGVVFNDTPDANTTLFPGSVTTTQGSITSGNAGTAPVTVNLGTIGVAASATVNFDVTVNALPAGVTQVSNQGTVSSNELPAVLTDDPNQSGSTNPTVTVVTGAALLRAAKTATLVLDNDSNGSPSPGDRLLYQIVITNAGTAASTGVTFTDTPDNNTAVVVGTVTTSAGVIISGNGGGDTSVAVSVGTMSASATTTITFAVTIANPLPAGVVQVANQGRIASNELPVLSTDDPAAAGSSDATVTTVVSSPNLRASKTSTLLTDADADGSPSPGDTLLYQVTVTNSGNTAATSVEFQDTPDVNTDLVSGSVATNRGTVTAGNAGVAPVVVAIGTLPGGGGSAVISFHVTIDNPLPANVSAVSNQGSVASAQLPTVLTDDPSAAGSSDPTTTAVTAEPKMTATKMATLQVDADNNGSPSPGDTLLYQIVITNTGNAAGTAAFLGDGPDVNAPLLAGSVQSSTGTVTSGNTLGDTQVAVDLGTIPGRGGQATISFSAMITTPLPANVNAVSNQGIVSGANFTSLTTDDPTTAASNDATMVAVTTAPVIDLTKVASLATDADADGAPSPGDTLRYTLTLQNSGNQAASDISISDDLDDASSLVVGSAQTNLGTVTVGNTTGDSRVVVTIPNLPGGGSTATVTFEVLVDDPLPAGVTTLRNQAQATGANFPTEPSDDPSTASDEDATMTSVSAAPSGFAEKTASLFIDADNDGNPSPGDTLLYLVRVVNTGNGAATGAVLNDIPDSNTNLVVGSVQTSQGTITSGNNPGDTSIAINVGTIPGRGGTFTGSFLVTIDDPLPPGVYSVSNQATGSSNELPVVVTNDPTTAAANDPTVTIVVAAPAGSANKRVTLFDDADGDGLASPGDTLLYRIDVQNTGNGAATGAFLNDNLDSNTTLVVGSVQTSQGTITSGNNPNDTNVAITIGSIPGRGGIFTATFLADINSPLPGGVTSIANQAVGGSNELPFVVTDDPGTATANDPTLIQIAASPVLDVSKTDSLAVDADNDGLPSPGDTILYVVRARNSGNTAATGTVVSDVIDANAALVVGSVQSSSGTVTLGNNPGDTSVSVNSGTIPGDGGEVTVSFLVVIDDPLGPGVNFIANQANVSSNELAPRSSDDPDTASAGDATLTLVTAAPAGSANKTVVLQTDADDNGVVSPGDTLLYTLAVQNVGNGAVTGAFMNDTPGANTTLVAGSFQISQGTITSGNGFGDTSVAANVGTIPARGGTFFASFLVTVDNPLPAGVTQVSNQATGGSNEIPVVVSNDPSTAAANDPTSVSIFASPSLSADKVAVLFNDADFDGLPSPGDTLMYQVTVTNSGNIAATGVGFDDFPDVNTSLVPGSVTISQGSILGGNGGTAPVVVSLGTINGGGGSAVVSFQVDVVNPLPAGVTTVSNQGRVTSNELPAVGTNDPTTAAGSDPTLTAVTAAPLMRASKVATLSVDADSDGVPSPGDTLQYSVTVRNSGNQAGTATVLNDILDTNTALVVGSVSASQGTVIIGNNPGDTAVNVDLGSISGAGASATVNFQVTIDSPLAEGVTRVLNQAQISGSNFPAQQSDDPETATLNDATATSVTSAPTVSAGKLVLLSNDADSNGVPSPGDTLTYTVTVTNTGNTAALDVAFSDTPDANTTLVAGSVQTTDGTITSGNAGAPPVGVSLGMIAGGNGSATISFSVTVNDPLPLGVTQVSNQAQISGSNFTTVNSGNPLTEATDDPTVTVITAAPLITTTKSGSLAIDADFNGVISPGDTILYTVSITNDGNLNASSVTFNDTPDNNTTLVVGSVQTSAGTIQSGNTGTPPVTVDIGAIGGGGGTVDISFRVTVDNPFPANTSQVSNQGSVSGANFSPRSTDDPSTAAAGDATALNVSNLDLVISKDHSGAFTVGTSGHYIIEVSNIGGSPTSGTVTVTDVLPNGLTYVSAVGTDWNCSAASQVVTCTRTTPLSGGATTSIFLTVAVGSAAYPTLTNSASVSFAGDQNASNNTAHDPTTVRASTAPSPTAAGGGSTPTGVMATATRTPTPASTPTSTAMPDLALSKSHSGNFTVGTAGSYHLTVINLGAGNTRSATTLTDTLPAGLTFVSASGSGWSCSNAGQTVTCSYAGTIPPGAATGLDLVVQVGSEAYPTLTNHATVATTGDSNANNNQASDPTTIRLGTEPTNTATATSEPGAPTPTPASGPCELAISKTHKGAVGPNATLKYRLRWSRCAEDDQLTITDALPDHTSLVGVVVTSDTTVQANGNTVTLRSRGGKGYGVATLRVAISANAAIGEELCNVATLSDSLGRTAQSTDCFRVKGEVAAQTLLLTGHSKSRPGRELTFTARYFNVTADNTLALTLPEHVTVVRILDPQPTSIVDRTYTWQNLPIISGKVRVTVQVDGNTAPDTILPVTAELISGKGRNTANHDTLVVIPASAGVNSTAP